MLGSFAFVVFSIIFVNLAHYCDSTASIQCARFDYYINN